MFTREFWAATFERAIKTFCQALVGVIGVAGLSPLDIDWKEALLAAGLATLLSVLSSIVSSGVGGNGGPSVGPELLKPVPPAAPADPQV